MAGQSEITPTLYDRQATIPLSTPPSLAVIGCGGVGAWVAIQAALAGVPKIFLVDPDILQPHNLNRLPFPEDKVGKAKVEVIQEFLAQLRPRSIIYGYQARANKVVLAGLAPAVVGDFTDDERTQTELYEACKDLKIRYIRAGYDGGNHLTVCNFVPDWELPDESPQISGHYRVVPSWVASAVMVASMAIVKLMFDPNFQYSGNVLLEREDKVEVLT